MQISPLSLPEHLQPGVYELRTEAWALKTTKLSFTDALSLAYQGLVEGIATPAGRIKYLRELSLEERPIEIKPESIDDGKSTAFAQTNMGVFRQPVRAAVVKEYLGFRYVEESGEIVGHVYAHCALR